MNKWFYVFVIIIAMLPTTLGYFGSDLVYSGLESTTDGNVYLSIINQAKDGQFLFTNMHTSEEFPALDVRPTYLVGGWISKFTNISSIWVYHILRIASIILLIYFLDKLISIFFDKKLLPMVITLFASGFGYFLYLLTFVGFKQYGSIDLWVNESNNFLILLSHPHTILSVALMCSVSYYLLKWDKETNFRYIILASVYGFILGFEHLFDLITLFLAFGLFYILKIKKLNKQKIGHLITLALITAVPFIYTYIMFTNPLYANWNSQNILETPSFIHIIMGYGIMFISAILFLLYIIVTKNKIKRELLFFILWFVSVVVLIYSPFNIQRRFLEGAHVPLGIICSYFMVYILNKYIKLNKKNYQAFLIVILLFMIPTNIYQLVIKSNANEGRGYYPFAVPEYLNEEEYEGMIWLKDNTPKNAVIISTYNLGNYIPSISNRNSYLGHWAQTIDIDNKKLEIEKFYSGDSSSDSFILLPNPTYVWYGVDERRINPEFVYSNEYETVFKNNLVEIYK